MADIIGFRSDFSGDESPDHKECKLDLTRKNEG